MTLPMLGEIDPLAIAALGFLAATLGITAALFLWLQAQMRKRPGQR